MILFHDVFVSTCTCISPAKVKQKLRPSLRKKWDEPKLDAKTLYSLKSRSEFYHLGSPVNLHR